MRNEDMRPGIPTGGWTGKALTWQFAILSLIIITLITAGLSMVISYYLKNELLEWEWRVTAAYIRAAVFDGLTGADFEDPWSREAQEHFQAFYQHVIGMPEIVRVKIFTTSMSMAWSDEPRLIGQRFPDSPRLRRALAGETVVRLFNVDHRGANAPMGYQFDKFSQLATIYVPVVFPGTTEVAGVVETYQIPTWALASIQRGQRIVVGTVIAGSVVLYLSLSWIVRRAGRHIDAQHAVMEHRSRALLAVNQTLEKVQTRLLEVERMTTLSEVVAAVAHGIRNPLANIRASAQVALLDYQASGQSTLASKRLGHIVAEVDRLEGRLKKALQFIHPGERQSRFLDLNTLLRGTLELVAERAAKADIEVEQRLAASLPLIMGDAMFIEEVLLSLINNAIEVIPAGGGTITVSTGTESDKMGALRVFVEVRDSGVGIAPEEQTKIFAPFYTTKAQGTGLGLAIAKKFTEAHGGTISVQSQPGEGSTFRVTFPAPMEA